MRGVPSRGTAARPRSATAARAPRDRAARGQPPGHRGPVAPRPRPGGKPGQAGDARFAGDECMVIYHGGEAPLGAEGGIANARRT
jgi:hypothetical protein